MNPIASTTDCRDFIQSIKSRLQSAQIKATVSVNQELLLLYWAEQAEFGFHRQSRVGVQCDQGDA